MDRAEIVRRLRLVKDRLFFAEGYAEKHAAEELIRAATRHVDDLIEDLESERASHY